MTRIIATFFYIGLLPKAPGTWGSLAALPCAMIIHALGSFPALVIATVAVFGVGLWATARETAGQTDHDPSEIVIDEVAGQWVGLFAISGGMWWMQVPFNTLPWPGLLGGFVLFRAFDILKPWPVSWADRMNTPLGVMLDDILAGLMASIVVLILAALAHGWM